MRELAEYLEFVRFALTWHGEAMPLYLDGGRAGRTRRSVAGLPAERQLELGVANRSTIAWARVKGAEQTRRAHAFKHVPSLVLKEGAGDSRLLVWLLDEPLSWDRVEALNRRIAYRLGGCQRHGEPDMLRIPGTGLSYHERPNPVAVAVTRMELEEHKPGLLLAGLREPPKRRNYARV